MLDIEQLYYEWLLTRLHEDGVTDEVAYLGGLLHDITFKRRVGNDINRAVDGANLRKEFMAQFSDANFDPHVTNDLMEQECTWFEMLIALSKVIDYSYDGGVEERFVELTTNMGLDALLHLRPRLSKVVRAYDWNMVEQATSNVDGSHFDFDGRGGLFPLYKPGHPDQRGVEIWDQLGAYFHERLESLWTSRE